MNYRYLVALFLLLPTFPLLNACSDDPTSPGDNSNPLRDSLGIQSRTFNIGVSGLVPRNWPDPLAEDWENLYTLLPKFGELLGVHVGWNDNLTGEDIPEGVAVAYLSTDGSDVEPYVALGFEPDAMTRQEADDYFLQNGDRFKEVAVAIAEKYKPGILLLGVEANRFFEKSPAGFDDFVDVYDETYAAVKGVSPGTKIGTNFQYEYMLGKAAYTGVSHTEHLNLIDRFDGKLDVVTLTVYPWLDYDDPGSIPVDYFAPIRQHTSSPLMITETGWPSEPISGTAIVGTGRAQIEFLKWLLAATDGETMAGLVWAFPHDPNSGIANGAFDHISMRENSGDPKEVWDFWQALREL